MILDRYYDIYLIKRSPGLFMVQHKGGSTTVPSQARANILFNNMKATHHASK